MEHLRRHHQRRFPPQRSRRFQGCREFPLLLHQLQRLPLPLRRLRRPHRRRRQAAEEFAPVRRLPRRPEGEAKP